MKKIIQLITAAFLITIVLFSTGCQKTNLFDTQNWSLIRQDGLQVSTTSNSYTPTFNGTMLNFTIPINNEKSQRPGSCDVLFSNISFAAGSTTSLPLGNNNNNFAAMTYSNYFTDSKGNTVYKTFVMTPKSTGAVIITQNDPNTRRMAGTIQDVVLHGAYDAYKTDSTIINCQFYTGY